MPKPLDTSGMVWSDYFVYDESSPTFLRWATDIYTTKGVLTPYGRKGYVAGKKNGERATVLLHGKRYKVHRVIWELLKGPIPQGMIVDHEDGNHLNNAIGNLRPVRSAINTRNAAMRKDNASGATGVSRISNGRGTFYWVARWQGDEGKTVTKRFNVSVGEDEAFRLACEHRSKMINALNAQGAGYTERHGKC